MSTAPEHDADRAAQDLAEWRRRAGMPSGIAPGQLYEVTGDDGHRHLHNLRKLTIGSDRTPGSAVIGTAAWLLLGLAGGVMAVSFAGQFAYLDGARHQAWAANIESGMFDAGMIILSMLALGLAMAGKKSRAERVLIMLCAAGSAAMGYAAADVSSPRSVAAYVAPPVFLAIIVDRVIAVVRRHVLGDDETSPWAGLGRFALACLKLAGLVLLYTLRLVLDPKHTPGGLRRVVLAAAPLPEAPLKVIALESGPAACPAPIGGGETCGGPVPCDLHPDGTATSKRAALIAWYRRHPDYGDRAVSSRVASELAAKADLQSGTARTYILAELARSNP